MSEGLKPCPFCGLEITEPYLDLKPDMHCFMWYVFCNNCNSRGEPLPEKDKAIESWNDRLIDDALMERIEKLEDAAKLAHDALSTTMTMVPIARFESIHAKCGRALQQIDFLLG